MEKRPVDLIYLLDTHNVLTHPLGVSVRRKMDRKRISPRLILLLVVSWLDTLYTIGHAFIPTEGNEELLLRMGDFAFHVVNEKRYHMVGVMVFYRLSATIMLSFFAWDGFDWAREANRILARLNTRPSLAQRLIRARNRSRFWTVSSSIWMSLTIMSALLVSTLMPDRAVRNAKYGLIKLAPAYAYVCYYAAMYTCLHVSFMMELNFLCKVCQELFGDINGQFRVDAAARIRDGT